MDTPRQTTVQERRRRRWIVPILALFLACFAMLWFFSVKFINARLHRDDDYLTAKARELDFEENQIRLFVKDNVGKEAYEGALRGALGTLWSGAGNELDRALLFQALLERSRLSCRLVHGKVWGVEVREGQTYRYAGPDLAADPEAQPVADLAPVSHILEAVLRTTPNAGAPIEEKMEFRIADLIGKDLTLSYRIEDGQAHAVLQGSSVALASKVDAKTAMRQELVFRFRGPGGYAAERVRELFSAEYKDFPSLFDLSNRHTFVLTAGWIPDAVFLKETELAQDWPDHEAALRHTLAYAFLARSDSHARELREHLKATAFFTAPRLTDIATEYHEEGGKKTRSVSIDLRKNDLRVDGDAEARVAFGSARSLFDASLEAAVLTEFTGESAVSSMDLLADAMARRQATLAQRQSLLQRSLKRLFDEAREGATLSVAPEGKETYTVIFTREKDGLRVEVSEDLRKGLTAAGGGQDWVLGRPKFAPGEIEKAAQETEVALALSAKMPMRYEQVYNYTEVPTDHWYENARFFSYYEKRLCFEFQNLTINPDRKVEVVDYYDDVGKQWFDSPRRAALHFAKENLEHARIYTNWYNTHPDQTIDGISRDAYLELKEKGSTVLRCRFHDGSLSEPIRLQISDRYEATILLNNRPFKHRRLALFGNYDRLVTDKMTLEEIAKLPPIKDADGAEINNFSIIDDPEFPIRCNFERVQSAIPGRVTDAETGHGVPEARVTVLGPNTAALSWADGRFSISGIKEPFREFEVAIEAPGYKPARVKIDFLKADAFPLALKLEAAPLAPKDAFVKIDRQNAPSVLPGVKLGARAKALISEALRTNETLAVMVPTFEVCGTYGSMDAWYEIDTKTGECYGRLSDGLYGSTNSPYWAQHKTISYFSGRIAAWYLFAAGAMDGVAENIQHPEMTLDDLYRHASKTAHELAKIYDGYWFDKLGGQVADMGAFKKGLEHGLAWADDFYKKAWGVK
ncbi:MAG: carboxypeptidase regulatory-like domain-containing protein [Planctomycetes bacterium]|nr:carboxypeptidase regulatory-like domain-containing protein [Planctomycetota bacterium]